MNKESIKEFLNLVEVRCNANDGDVSFSTWHTAPYDTLTPVAEFLLSKSNRFTYHDYDYSIRFDGAIDGKGGMSEGSPDTWIVSRVVEEAIAFDADEFIERNTFRILDWKTGTERIEGLGYDTTLDYETKDLFEIAEDIFNSGYDIRIDNHDGGNVILLIDDKRFKHS